MPSDSALREALASSARKAATAGETVTVNLIRQRVEAQLDLEAGYFKSAEWKEESRSIINDAVLDEAEGDAPEAQEEVKPPSKTKKAEPVRSPKPKPKPKPKVKPRANNKKRSRRDDSDSEGEESSALSSPLSELKESEDEPPKKKSKSTSAKPSSTPTKAKASTNSQSKSPANGAASSKVEDDFNNGTGGAQEESESELSVLLDDTPPRKRSKNIDKTKNKSKPNAKPSKPAKDTDLSPDEAEIKRLQSWLLKCGIRKLWHRELAPYDSSRAKIKHLKEMLAEVGMDGRYSVEKAARIKEERELKADLEAVQEGAKVWGDGEEEEPEESTRPKRKLARGLKDLAMFDEDDSD